MTQQLYNLAGSYPAFMPPVAHRDEGGEHCYRRQLSKVVAKYFNVMYGAINQRSNPLPAMQFVRVPADVAASESVSTIVSIMMEDDYFTVEGAYGVFGGEVR